MQEVHIHGIEKWFASGEPANLIELWNIDQLSDTSKTICIRPEPTLTIEVNRGDRPMIPKSISKIFRDHLNRADSLLGRK